MIRFLVFGDLHMEDCVDGMERLEKILNHAKEEHVDFVVSLGDLCFPTEDHIPAMELIRSCGIPVHHTIGNHDVQDWEIGESLRFLWKEKPYEAFEAGEYRFIILDTCYWKSEQGEYHFPNKQRIPSLYPYLPREQRDWLEQQLSQGKKNLIFSHMSLVNPFARRGIANKEAVQQLFEGKDILLCMNQIEAKQKLSSCFENLLGGSALDYLHRKVGIVETVAICMCPELPVNLAERDPLGVLTNGYPEMPMDVTAFKGEPPISDKILLTDNLSAEFHRKMYTFNTAYAAIGYLGAQKHYAYATEAMEDITYAGMMTRQVDFEYARQVLSEFLEQGYAVMD